MLGYGKQWHDSIYGNNFFCKHYICFVIVHCDRTVYMLIWICTILVTSVLTYETN